VSLPRRPDGSADPLWIAEMAKYLGIVEVIKGQLNPVIAKMFAATHFPPEKLQPRTPWCSAALCAVMEALGIRSTRSAAALSWAEWGVESDCVPGSIAVFKHDHVDAGATGHVSIVVGMDGDQILCLGANQSNSVRRSWYKKSSVLCYRWPADQ
jgi:uncharacterized protein (TIGR02594 family)